MTIQHNLSRMRQLCFQHGSRDVLVLLEREAEDTITVTTKTDLGPSQGIHVERVTSSSFVATLPSKSVTSADIATLATKSVYAYMCTCVHIYIYITM